MISMSAVNPFLALYVVQKVKLLFIDVITRFECCSCTEIGVGEGGSWT